MLMNWDRWTIAIALSVSWLPPGSAIAEQEQQGRPSPREGRGGEGDRPGEGQADDRPDSFRYYGPIGPDEWTEDLKRGRDTWIFWTGGNQKFFRLGTQLGGQFGTSIEYFRLLELDRDERFRKLGLINEPNCRPPTPEEVEANHGLAIDHWEGDPYPDDYPDTEVYGEPSGIVGLRKFPNPNFNEDSWQRSGGREGYFERPWAVEPPYLVGMTCAFCHMAFDPTNPPADPADPRWDNLAANIGNQYLREGLIFLGEGKVVMGDRNNGRGLDDSSFLNQYAQSQQPGTSETSRLSYDFINNPNTINPIFFLKDRARFEEVMPDGSTAEVPHILKDGADSVGIARASLRVYVNIGMEGEYWIKHLWNPSTGRDQRPFDIEEVEEGGFAVGRDWRATAERMADAKAFLELYTPLRLEDAPGGDDYLEPYDSEPVARGKRVFAENCAQCHSNKQPEDRAGLDADELLAFYRESVAAEDFRDRNTLTDDVRYPVTGPVPFGPTTEELGTNMARALASNAVEGHVWEQFSSRTYKQQPRVPATTLQYPYLDGEVISLEFQPPGGGRGYYRSPSLVSLWATAPYLHNNSLGDYIPDPSVEQRMKAFDDGIRKLLWPERRDRIVKRTTKPSRLDLNIPALEDGVARLAGSVVNEPLEALSRAAGSAVHERLGEIVYLQVPDEAFRKLYRRVNPLARVVVPEGMPIDLLANIHVDNAIYAVAALVSDKDDPKALVPRLLELSECPDLIQDRGHLYGADLPFEDKQALIEFLKHL